MKPLLWILLFCCAIPGAAAATLAAEVETLEGTAWAQLANQPPRRLRVGSSVYSEDRLRTESDAAVQLRFTDGTTFELGEGAEMAVGDYRYSDTGQDVAFTPRILKGAFRFITGLIALRNRDAVTVNVAVATIGIRGTHVAGEVTGEGEAASVVLLEPEGEEAAPTSIVVANAHGSVVISQAGWGTEIPDANSAPTPPRPFRLNRINTMLRSIHTIRRIKLPRPPPTRRGP